MEIINKIVKNAREIKIKGNKPIVLNNNKLIWLVTNGNIQLFASKNRNGKPFGYKYHITTIEKGEIFFGIEHNEIILTASGEIGTTVFEIDIKDFFDYSSSDEKSILINLWIENISSCLTKDIVPKKLLLLDKNKHIKLEKNNIYSSQQNVIWIFSEEKNLKFINKLECSKIPVTKKTWIKAIESSMVDIYYTDDIVNNQDFLSNLRLFNLTALNIILDNMKLEKQLEAKRLQNKSKQKFKQFIQSIESIKNVLLPKKRKKFVGYYDDTPLLKAVSIIGDYLKINIKKHHSDNTNLENILRASKIKARKVTLIGNWWKNDSGPLLCFLKEDKIPVAVIPQSATSYYLINPENNEKIKIDENIVEKLEIFAYTFYKPLPEKSITGWELFKFGMQSCGIDIWSVFLVGICGSLLGLFTPVATGIIFDTVIPESSKGQLFQIAFILVSCAIATLLFNITKATAILRIEGKADLLLQTAIWDRLISLPVPFFRNFSSGDLAMRSMSIDAIRMIISGITIQSILAFIFSVFYWLLLFYYNVDLALIATLLAIILIIITFFIGYLCVKYQEDITIIKNKLSGTIFQFLSGISKLKITGTELNSFGIWAKEFSKQKELSKKLGISQSAMKSFVSFFPLISICCIFSWVAFKVKNNITTGEFLSFNSAYSTFQTGMLQMSMALVSSLNIIPLYKNLKPIIETLPEVSEAKEHPGELIGNIEIKHVDFRYHKDLPLVLKDISINVNQGEFVAIVGSSGSGKSTLFRLLLGFETPERGKIFFDGKDLDTLDIIEVRRQFGVVLQNSKLLQGSILQNIVGSSNLTIDDAWEAAKMAGCYDDIQSMPMKMHTVVPPGGGNLSGGQRQRIIIARALIKKPKILFLDEATSSLDNRSQEIVSKSIEEMNITRVVIAHRLSTIINADKIYCLEKGQIVETGNYVELMKKKGFFYELAKRQQLTT